MPMSEQEPPIPAAPRGRAWQRWQVAALEAEAGTGTDHPAARPATATIPPPPEEVDPRALIAQWREQAERQGHELGYAQGLEAGRRDGLARGLEEGRQQGHAEALARQLAENTTLHQRLQTLVAQAGTAMARLDREVGDALVLLAMDIARDIVRAELNQRPDAILPLVREVLALHPQQPLVALRLQPEDCALVQSQLTAELGATACQLIADPALHTGDCLVETRLGAIDATLRARWQQHAAALGVQHGWDDRQAPAAGPLPDPAGHPLHTTGTPPGPQP